MVKSSNELQDIFKSWGFLIKLKLRVAKLTQEDLEVVNERLIACNSCTERKFNICKVCGCYLPAKVLSITQKCKLGKWKI